MRAWVHADDVDEEDRRPTQRRRLEEAQAGGFDENMEPLVSNHTSHHDARTPHSPHAPAHSTVAMVSPCRVILCNWPIMTPDTLWRL